MPESVGKKAEKKVREWLDKPELGYCFDRIPDQLSGLYGSRNICDFILFKSPNLYYIESKATESDRWDFSNLSPYQHDMMLEKCKIDHVYSAIVLLFASYKRAFVINIREIKKLEDMDKHSLNIKKIKSWGIDYVEIQTVPNSRKQLLDYTGEFRVAECNDNNYNSEVTT